MPPANARHRSSRVRMLSRRRLATGRSPALPAGPSRRQLSRSPLPRRRLRFAFGKRRRTAPPQPSAAGGEQPRSEELARLEAALFVAREPLPVRRLAKLARLPDATRARTLLRELNQLLDAAGAAFRVEHLAGGYQLLTRPQFGPWIKRALEYPAENRLSTAALETLAIVAYRQPVTRPDIESIRGVGSEEMLRQLLDRDLIAVGGRSDELGRPNLYSTSRYFLRVFGLGRIEDLPPVETGDPPISRPAGPEHRG